MSFTHGGGTVAVPRTFVNCTKPTLATIDAIRPRVVDPKFWDGGLSVIENLIAELEAMG